MSILDFDDTYKEPWSRKRVIERERTDEERFSDLNNMGHDVVSEDFSDSPFADRA